MKPADTIVLDTLRPLVVETLALCQSPDIASLKAALPAFSEKMKAAHVAPVQINAPFADAGLLSFSAWGFTDGAPRELELRSFFLDIRMQQAGKRTITTCQITDMTTEQKATKLGLVEADWLKALEPMTKGAAQTLKSNRPATPQDDATFETYFDLSTPEAVQSLTTYRILHKLELNFMRATAP
ncbi:hypothetical protein ACLBXM_12585 [Xanthobacteraceae bacterium A53D]